MIDFSALASVGSIYLIGLFVPGPNFMVVVHSALRHGRPEALASMAGVVLVNTMWASASLFGLALIVNLVPWAFSILKVAGAVYLGWVGIGFWRNAGKEAIVEVAHINSDQLLGAAFRRGLATNLSNVKAIVFYASAISASTGPKVGETTLFAAVLLIAILATCYYSLVGLLFSGGRMRQFYKRRRSAIDKGCGSIMVALAVRLLISS